MRRPLTARCAAAAVAFPLLLSFLTACGSEEEATVAAPAPSATVTDEAPEEETPGKRRKKKQAAQAEATTAPEEVPAAETGAPSPAPVPASKDLTPAEFVQLFDSSLRGPARMTMSVKGPMETSAAGDVDYSTTPASMAMTMTSSQLGGEVKVVLVDNVVYMNMGGLSNNKFFKADLDGPQGMIGRDITSQLDPKESLAALQKGITSVTLVGEEQVEGVRARRYAVTVDPAKLGTKGGPSTGLPKRIAYDVWFDEQDRLRRTVLDLGPGNGVVTKSFSGWGEKVSIKAPPASQIADLPATGY